MYSVIVFIQARHSLVPRWNPSSLPLARFGMKVTGLNILNWSVGNFDNAFVGRAFGSASLGLYSRAFNTVSGPSEAIVSTWQQVLFASCSRLGDRVEASQRAYLSSVSAVALIIFPVFWSIAACAPAVVAALYGNRWAEMAPLLRPLSLGITLNAIMAMAGPMLGAANQVKREVKAQALTLTVAIAAFSVCIRYSAEAVAWAVLGVYLFRCFAATRPTLRLLRLEWTDFFRALRGPIIASSITTAAVWGAGRMAATYSVRPAYAVAGLSLAGVSTLSLLVLWASDHILPRELVLVLTQLSNSFPSAVVKQLRSINSKQVSRNTRAAGSIGEPLFTASNVPR